MSFLGVTYVHEKDENFKEFLDAIRETTREITLGKGSSQRQAVPPEKAEVFLKTKSSAKLEKDGDTYSLTTITPNGEKVIKFENGVEFEEQITDTITAKTTFTVEDNVVTQVQTFQDGRSITYKREFTDNELIVSLQICDWDGTAKRYYAAH